MPESIMIVKNATPNQTYYYNIIIRVISMKCVHYSRCILQNCLWKQWYLILLNRNRNDVKFIQMLSRSRVKASYLDFSPALSAPSFSWEAFKSGWTDFFKGHPGFRYLRFPLLNRVIILWCISLQTTTNTVRVKPQPLYVAPLQIQENDFSYRHPYILKVKGQVGSVEIFSNSTQLHFDPKGLSTFIQTDKLNYLPGQDVKIRVVSIHPDGKPFVSPVDIIIRVSLTSIYSIHMSALFNTHNTLFRYTALNALYSFE